MVCYINGFLIVGKSWTNTAPYHDICRLGNKEYLGKDRPDSLDDLYTDYYQRRLPPEIHRILTLEKEESSSWPYFQYIEDYVSAVKVLEFVNKQTDLHELIEISSDEITKAKGSFEFDTDKIEWLGYDITRIGGESMILGGLFFKPDRFAKWIDVINKFGLFPNKERIQEYIDEYKIVAKDNVIEPYGPKDLGYDVVKVGRIV